MSGNGSRIKEYLPQAELSLRQGTGIASDSWQPAIPRARSPSELHSETETATNEAGDHQPRRGLR